MNKLLTYYLSVKLASICETDFHYRDKSPPIYYTVSVASNMQVCLIACWIFVYVVLLYKFLLFLGVFILGFWINRISKLHKIHVV